MLALLPKRARSECAGGPVAHQTATGWWRPQ